MKFREILAISLLLIAVVLVSTNSDLFLNSQTNRIITNESDVKKTVEPTVDTNDLGQNEDKIVEDPSLWSKMMNFFLKEEPTIELAQDKVDVLSTDYKTNYSTKELEEMFGVNAKKGSDEVPVDIKLSKKIDNAVDVEFTTDSQSSTEASASGVINIIHNQKPIIKIQNRKVTIRETKLSKMSDEDLIKFIINHGSVKATDKEDKNKEIALIIDLSKLDRNKPGEYELKAIATDSANQKAEQSIILKVK